MTHAVAIVPAFNRADTVADTVTALLRIPEIVEVIVVDDGSRDRTAAVAATAGARVVELARNRGKGAAVAAGIAASGAPGVYLLIDADLGASAALAGELLEPVVRGEADMSIAVFDAAEGSSGFGLVKGFAACVLRSKTGCDLAEPLSGQRAVRGSLLRALELAPGFGLEVGLTLDACERGAVVKEIPVGFTHRPSGRNLRGGAHRARIGRHVCLAVVERIGWPSAVGCLAASLCSRVRLPRWLSLRRFAGLLRSIRSRRHGRRIAVTALHRLRTLLRVRRRRPSGEP